MHTENRAGSAAVPQDKLPPVRPAPRRCAPRPSSTDAILGRIGLPLRGESSARRFERSDSLPRSVAAASA